MALGPFRRGWLLYAKTSSTPRGGNSRRRPATGPLVSLLLWALLDSRAAKRCMYGRPKVTRIRAISQAIRLKWNGRRVHRWSGQVLETVDYAGFIGRDP